VWIDGYDVNGGTFFNIIFRAADGTPWQARHGLDGAQYQQEFTTLTGQGYRLMHIESYLSGNTICYAPIFVKSPGPEWVAYHGRTADEHQQQFDTLTPQGFIPVNVTAVSIQGVRTYAALYEKKKRWDFLVEEFPDPRRVSTRV
jgi:hypothetical protein